MTREMEVGRSLTPRELEILDLLGRGASDKQIARRLSIASGTVKTHVSSIILKLGAANRAGAVGEAYRRGLLD
jgi:DNA-binding NarL/FixJ family response regulator